MPSTNGHGSSGAAERIAFYMRTSSDEQREAGTIQTQDGVLRAYAARMGYEIVETYADDGVPGVTPLHECPAGRKLLADAKEGNSIPCWSTSSTGSRGRSSGYSTPPTG